MFMNKQQKHFLLVTVVWFLGSVKSDQTTEPLQIAEIDEIFNNITENQEKLKVVIKDLLEEVQDDCQCVPFHLCTNNGVIIRDGEHHLSARSGTTNNTCRTLGDICCNPSNFVNSSSEAMRSLFVEPNCGYGSASVTENWANPNQAQFAEFPWMVTILTDGLRFQCEGTLIHPKVVLTAAHCVNDTETYTIRAGEWDISNVDEPLADQDRTVQSIIVHPKYNEKTLYFDAALLILEEAFTIRDNVNTACLSDFKLVVAQESLDNCVSAGWGMDINRQYQRILKKVPFSLLEHIVCEKRLRKTRLGKWYQLHESFVCGTNIGDHNVCAGDGGAPLLCPVPDQPGRFQQVGILSWGIECISNTESVFTKVSRIRSWIDLQFDLLDYETTFFTYD